MIRDVNLWEKYYRMPRGHWSAAEKALDWMESEAGASAVLNDVLANLAQGNQSEAEFGSRALHQMAESAAPERAEGVYSAVCAAALPQLLDRMHKNGVPEDVIADTVSDYRTWAESYRRETGREGFGEIGWGLNFLAGKILKLGRLQFERSFFRVPMAIVRRRSSGALIPVPHSGVRADENGWIEQRGKGAFETVTYTENGVLKYNEVDTARAKITRTRAELPLSDLESVLTAGMRVLYVHIPETGPLDDGEVSESLHRAKEYFAAEGFPCRCAVCESWLLDPALMEYGAGCSNLERFQKRFTLYPELSEHSEAVSRVFGRGTDASNPDLLPEKTRLQRGLKHYLKTNRPLRDAGGILLLE